MEDLNREFDYTRNKSDVFQPPAFIARGLGMIHRSDASPVNIINLTRWDQRPWFNNLGHPIIEFLST